MNKSCLTCERVMFHMKESCHVWRVMNYVRGLDSLHGSPSCKGAPHPRPPPVGIRQLESSKNHQSIWNLDEWHVQSVQPLQQVQHVQDVQPLQQVSHLKHSPCPFSWHGHPFYLCLASFLTCQRVAFCAPSAFSLDRNTAFSCVYVCERVNPRGKKRERRERQRDGERKRDDPQDWAWWRESAHTMKRQRQQERARDEEIERGRTCVWESVRERQGALERERGSEIARVIKGESERANVFVWESVRDRTGRARVRESVHERERKRMKRAYTQDRER